MTIRSILTSKVPTAAIGGMLLVLSAASLGCAFAACYGAADPLLAALPAVQDRAAATTLPQADAPVAQPMAEIAEPARCNGGPGSRARRAQGGLCRIADLPPV